MIGYYVRGPELHRQPDERGEPPAGRTEDEGHDESHRPGNSSSHKSYWSHHGGLQGHKLIDLELQAPHSPSLVGSNVVDQQ